VGGVYNRRDQIEGHSAPLLRHLSRDRVRCPLLVEKVKRDEEFDRLCQERNRGRVVGVLAVRLAGGCEQSLGAGHGGEESRHDEGAFGKAGGSR
jgi:hypothetical protein